MTQRGRRKKNPAHIRQTRYSVYVSEALDEKVSEKWSRIQSQYGSLNNWINHLIEEWVKRV